MVTLPQYGYPHPKIEMACKDVTKPQFSGCARHIQETGLHKLHAQKDQDMPAHLVKATRLNSAAAAQAHDAETEGEVDIPFIQNAADLQQQASASEHHLVSAL